VGVLDDTFTHQLAHSGRVRRYHTWAVHHQQTVGEHCWQVSRVYTAIFGRPEADVAHYIAHHDSAELVVGDPPFPIKARNPILKAAYDSLETIALQELGVALPALSPRERARVKLCDLVEMHEFGLLEVEMGNRHAREVVDNTLAAIHKIIGAPGPANTPDALDNSAVAIYLGKVRSHHLRIMAR
jgi:5'-deoxynucleotidase YfbR-like HD superfamily hydrolase